MKTLLILLSLFFFGCSSLPEEPSPLYCYHSDPRAKQDPNSEHIYAPCQNCWNEEQKNKENWKREIYNQELEIRKQINIKEDYYDEIYKHYYESLEQKYAARGEVFQGFMTEEEEGGVEKIHDKQVKDIKPLRDEEIRLRTKRGDK